MGWRLIHIFIDLPSNASSGVMKTSPPVAGTHFSRCSGQAFTHPQGAHRGGNTQ